MSESIANLADKATATCEKYRDRLITQMDWMIAMSQIHYNECGGDPWISAIVFSDCFPLLSEEEWETWFESDLNGESLQHQEPHSGQMSLPL